MYIYIHGYHRCHSRDYCRFIAFVSSLVRRLKRAEKNDSSKTNLIKVHVTSKTFF